MILSGVAALPAIIRANRYIIAGIHTAEVADCNNRDCLQKVRFLLATLFD